MATVTKQGPIGPDKNQVMLDVQWLFEPADDITTHELAVFLAYCFEKLPKQAWPVFFKESAIVVLKNKTKTNMLRHFKVKQ